MDSGRRRSVSEPVTRPKRTDWLCGTLPLVATVERAAEVLHADRAAL
jgi:hypothetical protein